MSEPEETLVDARGLDCPLPLLKAKQALNGVASGARVRVLATDKGSVRDFSVFAEQSGNLLLAQERQGGEGAIERDSTGRAEASAEEYMYLLQKK